MAIRATISIELLQASVSSARTTTSVTYELSHATGIWTDPDSNNRMPKDEFPLSDVRFSLVEKNLSDNVPLVDVSAYDFSALKEDSFTFADTFTVAYHHSFTDAFTLDDLSQIDKDFYGNKGNVAFMLDIIGLDQNKVLTDSYTVSDVIEVAMLWVRGFTDTFKVYDENPNALNVNLLNSQAMNAQDTSFLNDSGLGKGDALGFSEITAFVHSKGLTDSAIVVDSSSVSLNKPKTDSFGMSDNNVVASGVNPSDSISFSDSHDRTLSKALSDAFALDDSALINKDFTGSKGNVFGFSDVLSKTVGFNRAFTDAFSFSDDSVRSLNKGINDSSVLNDLLSFSQTKKMSESLTFNDVFGVQLEKTLSDTFKIYDENPNALNVNLLNSQAMNAQDTPFLVDRGLDKGDALGFSEITAFNHAKVLSDLATFNDVYGLQLEKTFADGFALDDSALINKDFTGNKGNVFGFGDVVSVVNTFKREFTDTFKIYDENPNALNVNLLNSQAMNAQDTAFLVDRGLDKGDALGFSEITAFNHAKVLSDLATFNDDYGVQLEKTLSDSFTLDDSALIDKDYFGNKGNIVGVSDQVTVDYYYGGLVGQRPLNTMSLN